VRVVHDALQEILESDRSDRLAVRGPDTHHYNLKLARRTYSWRVSVVALLLLTATVSSASAQNYSFDARRIALGGAGGTPNVASKLVERQRRYMPTAGSSFLS
jgi:hypothetical protein